MDCQNSSTYFISKFQRNNVNCFTKMHIGKIKNMNKNNGTF